MRHFIMDYLILMWEFIKKQRAAIGTAAITALLLDVITGIIFGFGGAALFAIA